MGEEWPWEISPMGARGLASGHAVQAMLAQAQQQAEQSQYARNLAVLRQQQSRPEAYVEMLQGLQQQQQQSYVRQSNGLLDIVSSQGLGAQLQDVGFVFANDRLTYFAAPRTPVRSYRQKAVETWLTVIIPRQLAWRWTQRQAERLARPFWLIIHPFATYAFWRSQRENGRLQARLAKVEAAEAETDAMLARLGITI